MRASKEVAIPRMSYAPSPSLIEAYLPAASFHDAWSVSVDDSERTAFGWCQTMFAATPRWVSAPMSMRNRIVQLFGLKDLGSLSDVSRLKPEEDYRRGDRIGIFTFVEATPSEVLLCDDDKHLVVTLSLHRGDIVAGGRVVTVTTVVHVKNLLGRLYMVPVAPLHRMIVPRSLSMLGQGVNR